MCFQLGNVQAKLKLGEWSSSQRLHCLNCDETKRVWSIFNKRACRLFVCGQACMCTCRVWFTYKNTPLYHSVQFCCLLTTVTVGLWQCVLDEAIVYVRVCHPGSLSQLIFVASFFCQCTAIYCESSPPSGLSNCFGFEAGEMESTYTQRHTPTPLTPLTQAQQKCF